MIWNSPCWVAVLLWPIFLARLSSVPFRMGIFTLGMCSKYIIGVVCRLIFSGPQLRECLDFFSEDCRLGLQAVTPYEKDHGGLDAVRDVPGGVRRLPACGKQRWNAISQSDMFGCQVDKGVEEVNFDHLCDWVIKRLGIHEAHLGRCL